MHLDPNHIHIWLTDLSLNPVQEKASLAILSTDEQNRIHRIRLLPHKQRAIAARVALRRILALYLNHAPEDIRFGYSDHQKPYLDHRTDIQFNLAHSADQALVAVTLNHAIGVDIEKIQAEFNADIAKRYFSKDENDALFSLPLAEQTNAFYRLWARKEAIVKAIGTGLSLPLSSFTVSHQDIAETIAVKNAAWSLQSLPVFSDYASALASAQTIKAISYWRLTEDSYRMIT